MERRGCDFGFWILDFGLFAAVCAMMAGSAGAAIGSLDDIQFWTGSGPNRAGIVVDWNGDSAADEALVWGFRWEVTASGEDMLRAAIVADPRLFAKLGANGSLGVAVRGVGYDLSDDGEFALDDGTTFDGDGIAASGPTDGAGALDAADFYREGWFTGVWSYATANANPWPGGAWAFSGVGPTTRTLVDGAWDSWAFTPTFRRNAFAVNASAAVQPADFDSDGNVDGADFLTWQRGVGLSAGVVRNLGDATGDGRVSGADLALWRNHFECAAASPAMTSAPEPTSLTTCASAMFVLFFSVRKLSRSVS
jgi:hypothetical protein